MMVGTDQHVRAGLAALGDGSPDAHVNPADELQVPAVAYRQLNCAVQAVGQVTGRIGEALDELADGFPLHAPSLRTERTGWQVLAPGTVPGLTPDGRRPSAPRPGWVDVVEELELCSAVSLPAGTP